jgi:hypothetical protein
MAHARQQVGILSDSAALAFYRDHRNEYEAEARAIAGTNGTVSRAGGRLTIRVSHGKPLVFVDTLAEGDQHHRYLYKSWMQDLGVHDVESWFYEGGVHLVVFGKTGHVTIIPDRPISSPDKQRFAVASEDLEAGYDPNRLEIWRVSARGLTREFVLDGGRAWGPRDLEWLSPSLIRYSRTSLSAAGAQRSVVRWLRLVNGEWHAISKFP